MLKRAHVVNFQSVKDLEIDLNARIVLLSGPSDNGKSALLRAIKNAIFDGVGGSFFRIEEGKKKSKMAVLVESDRGKIQWDKSPKNATYTLNDTDVRDNCGKSVPKEVPEVMGLTSKDDMGENLHYRNQFQAAFLINDRGTKDAYRFISKLMGADIAIKGMYALEKTVRNLAGEIKVTEEFLEKAKEELSEYHSEEQIKGLDETHSALLELYMQQSDLKERNAKIEEIQGAMTKLEKITSRVVDGTRKTLNFVRILEELEQIKTLHLNVDKIKQQGGWLLEKMEKLHEVSLGVESKKIAANLDCSPMHDLIKSVNSLETQKKEAEKIGKLHIQLSLDKIPTIPSIEAMTPIYGVAKQMADAIAAAREIDLVYMALESSASEIEPQRVKIKNLETEAQGILTEMIGDCDAANCTLIKALGVSHG